MKVRSLLVTIITVAAAMFGGAMFGGAMVHPVSGSGFCSSCVPYAWTYSFTQLSNAVYPAHSSPSLTYNPHLSKIFFAYAAGGPCGPQTTPCGDLVITSSTDMTTWPGGTDTGQRADFPTIGLTYNPDNQKMYVVWTQISDVTTGLLAIQLMGSNPNDGTLWGSMVNIGYLTDLAPSGYYNNGPEILFDSTNHRLLVIYSTRDSGCACNQVYILQSHDPFTSFSLVSVNPVSVGGSAISVNSVPSFMFLNGMLYMTYASSDLSIHVAQSSDGITWTNKIDFPQESAYYATIAYNPVEQNFHMVYVGTSQPFYLYEHTSQDAITWLGVKQLYQDSTHYASSLNMPSLAFIPTKNVLLLGYTGTDGTFGCPCHDGHLYTMPEIAPTDGATFVSWTPPPTTMSPGQTVNVAVTMKNPDYQCCSNFGIPPVWNPPSSDPNPFRLGSQNPQDNSNWGFGRVDLTSIVVDGQQYTFSFSITAPMTPGTYNFQWRMVQETVQWFGDFTPNVQVQVVAGGPRSLDGDNQAYCSHSTTSCVTTLTTAHPNDVIIAYTFETLDLATSCTFHVSDTAGLQWTHRAEVSGRNDGSTGSNRDQLAEFWAPSANVLSSDSITESISGCTSSYGGEYNGLEVFAISGANFASPFDTNPSLPGTGTDSVSGQQSVTTVTVSTSNSPDFVFAGVQHSTAAVPSPGSGFSMIISTGGGGSEYQNFTGTVSNLGVSFSFSTSSYWEEIADAVH